MMKNNHDQIIRGICLVALLVVTGCASVTSTEPMGEKRLAIIPEEWEGVWQTLDGHVLFLTVVNAQEGALEATWVEEKDEHMILKPGMIFLGQAGEWIFASTPDEDETSTRYLWGRLKRDDEAVFVWSPDPEKLGKLVQDGVLPGALVEGDVLLDKLSASHYSQIASEQYGVLFDWDEPLVFRRINTTID